MEDLASVERAIAALEQQRGVLGDDVVGTALGPLLAQRSALEAQLTGEQRRLVTVLFADLADFTVLSRSLDAEDTRSVVNAYFSRWRDRIEEHGGVVEKFIGDAVMAVFGLRQAQEDDPHRAVRAALAMTAALPELNEELEREYGVTLAMRVGIDTGDVVVSWLGEREGHEFVAVGETVNRASRLQAAAPTGGALLSSATYRHVRGSFNCRPMPGLRLKGIDEPVDAYLAVSERPRGFRLDEARGVEGVETTTVGRDIELRQLQERFWDVVEDHRWQVVTVVGDAGVGKTRLLLELDEWLAGLTERVWWFRGRASQSGQNLAGALLRDVVTARFGIQESDDPDVVRRKCEDGMATAFGPGESTVATARLVATWLGFEASGDRKLAALTRDPQALREQASARLAEYFARLSDDAPVVILLEDLHWADDGSLAWLDEADAVLRDARMLVVATARPALFERRPRWGEGLDQHARMALEPLSRRESRALLSQLLQRVEGDAEQVTDLVVTAAEGNPFYIEELVKWLLDADVIVRDGETWRVAAEAIESAQVPSTLRGVLQARLDALSPPERVVLQRASVIGRVFWDDAVEHLKAGRGATVAAGEALDLLRRREVVYERETSSFEATREFLFKHALLRDVAYDGVLKAHRQAYHGLAAAWLEQVTERSKRADEYAGLIAEHFDRAGDPAAARWYLRAGRQAASVHALAEATRLLDRGLRVAPGDDAGLRFDLLAAREDVLDRIGDRAAQRADLAAMDALAPRLTDPGRQVALLLTHARLAFVSSEYEAAAAQASQASALAERAGLVDLAAEAHLWHGKVLTWDGDHEAARARLLEALAKSRSAGVSATVGETLRYLSMVASNQGDFATALDYLGEARDVHRAEGDLDGESTALAQFGTVYFNLGRLDEARDCLEQTLPIFRLSGHRYREAVALGNLATIASAQGHLGSARRWSYEALELTLRVDDREATATTLNVLGQLALAVGEWEEADDHLRRALAIAEEIEAFPIASDALHRLAMLALDRGRSDEALALVDRAIATADATGSVPEEAMVRLCRGRVRGRTGDLDGSLDDLVAARERFEQVGLATLAAECAAEAAAVKLHAGATEDAAADVAAVLPRLVTGELESALRPADMFLACHAVLAARGDPRAIEVSRLAATFVETRAAAIDDEGMRAGFLGVPANARLLRLDASAPAQPFSIPRPSGD